MADACVLDLCAAGPVNDEGSIDDPDPIAVKRESSADFFPIEVDRMTYGRVKVDDGFATWAFSSVVSYQLRYPMTLVGQIANLKMTIHEAKSLAD